MLERHLRFYEELDHRYSAIDFILVTFSVIQPKTLVTSPEENLMELFKLMQNQSTLRRHCVYPYSLSTLPSKPTQVL